MPKVSSHFLAELLAHWGPVEIKRMFGGLGAWRDGAFFALIVNGIIYFKVDATTRRDYEAAQSEPFSYTVTKGDEKIIKLIDGLWRVPDEVMEEPDALAAWAQKAWDIARSKPEKKPKSPKGFKGLGPKSATWLKSVGIMTQAELESMGAVATYRLLKARYPKEISLNLLWGLYAAINGLDARGMTQDIKDNLMLMLQSDPV